MIYRVNQYHRRITLFIMAEEREKHKQSIRFFNDREVRAVWDDEHNKWWFSVLDIIAAINEQDDYQKTRNYWKYLKTKLKKENNELVSATNRFKLRFNNGGSAEEGEYRQNYSIQPKGSLVSEEGEVNLNRLWDFVVKKDCDDIESQI